MEFLIEYRLLGLFIGVCTFLIIGLFHPVVVKAEYYWGTRCWWVFLLLGLGGMAVSLLTDNVLLAALAGVFAFSSLWTIKELFEQREPGWPRVGFPPIRKGRERNRKRRGRYGDACLWLSLFATGIVGCKRLSSPACEGIVLSGRMDSAARGFRSLAGGSGPCGNSRFGTVPRLMRIVRTGKVRCTVPFCSGGRIMLRLSLFLRKLLICNMLVGRIVGSRNPVSGTFSPIRSAVPFPFPA